MLPQVIRLDEVINDVLNLLDEQGGPGMAAIIKRYIPGYDPVAGLNKAAQRPQQQHSGQLRQRPATAPVQHRVRQQHQQASQPQAEDELIPFTLI